MRKKIDVLISLVLGYIVGELVTYSILTANGFGTHAPIILGQMGIIATTLSIIAIVFVSIARQRQDTAVAYIGAFILAIIIKSMDISTIIEIETTSPAMIIIPVLTLIYIAAVFRPQQGTFGNM